MPDYDSGYIKVYPQSAGKFGGIFIGGFHYKDDKHLKEMAEQIQRHVDELLRLKLFMMNNQ